jgi:hypothetical protein
MSGTVILEIKPEVFVPHVILSTDAVALAAMIIITIVIILLLLQFVYLLICMFSELR